MNWQGILLSLRLSADVKLEEERFDKPSSISESHPSESYAFFFFFNINIGLLEKGK